MHSESNQKVKHQASKMSSIITNELMKDLLMTQIMEVVSTKCLIVLDSHVRFTDMPELDSIDELHMPIYKIMGTFLADELNRLRSIVKGSNEDFKAFVADVFRSSPELEMYEGEDEELVSDILKLKYCFEEKDLDDILAKMYLRNGM